MQTLNRKPQDGEKFVVRMPDGMRDSIQRLAKRNFRSMNMEIVFQLERALTEAANEKGEAPA